MIISNAVSEYRYSHIDIKFTIDKLVRIQHMISIYTIFVFISRPT